MSGYYNDLTSDEQNKVLSASVGLKLNAKKGAPITRQDVNTAFVQATGKPLSQDYMRDPAVVKLMSMVTPGSARASSHRSWNSSALRPDPSTRITDKSMEARGIHMDNSSRGVAPATRYSAGASDNSRFGR